MTEPERRRIVAFMETQTFAAQLEALGNPTRLALFRLLVRAGDAGTPVGKLQERLDIPASTLSHHLRRLVTVGLVAQERSATTLFCKARYPAMRTLIGFLSDECCADGACGPPASSEKAPALIAD